MPPDTHTNPREGLIQVIAVRLDNLHADVSGMRDVLGALASLALYPSPYWYYPLILGAGVHALLYLLSDRYKLWSEVQAYKKQAQYYADDRRLLFAGYISKYYKLNISTERAYQLLKDQ